MGGDGKKICGPLKKKKKKKDWSSASAYFISNNTQLAVSVSQSGAPDSRFFEIRDYGLCRSLFLLMKESDSQTLEAHWSMSFFPSFLYDSAYFFSPNV